MKRPRGHKQDFRLRLRQTGVRAQVHSIPWEPRFSGARGGGGVVSLFFLVVFCF